MARNDIVSRYVLKAEDRTGKAFRSARKSVQRAEGVVRKYAGALAAVAGPAALGLLVKRSIDAARNLDVLSRAADTSIGVLSRQSFAVESVGISSEKYGDILKDMKDRVGDFISTGAGPMADFFEQIAPKVGVTAEQFRELSGPKALQLYVSSLEKANVSQSEMTFFMEAMASDSTRLLPLLRNNGEEMARLGREAEQLGVAYNGVEAQKMIAAERAIHRAGQAASGLGNTLAIELAPLIEFVADKFTSAAKRSDGFSDTVQSGMRSSAKAVSVMGNGVRGLEIIWESLKLAAQGVFLAIVKAAETGIAGFEKAFQPAESTINAVIRAINAMSGSEIEPINIAPFQKTGDQLGRVAQEITNDIDETKASMHQLAIQPLPTQKVDEFFTNLEENATAAAEKVDAKRNELQGLNDRKEEALAQKAVERQRKQAQKELQTIQQKFMSEREKLRMDFEKKRAIVQENFELDLIKKEERNRLLEKLTERHQQKLTKIEKKHATAREKFEAMTWQGQVKTVAGSLEQMTAGVANSNKTMFRINKAAGIANAIINTSQGVTKALSQYPPPLSFVMAAAQLAAGLAQVKAIKSQQFGGGTTPSKAATPTVNGQPVGKSSGQGNAGGAGAAGRAGGLGQNAGQTGEDQRDTVVIENTPDLMSGESVNKLIDGINKAVADGKKLRVRTQGS